MTYDEILAEARTLTREDRKRLALAIADRAVLAAAARRDFDARMRYNALRRSACHAAGIEALDADRKRASVWARYCVMYAMRLEGFSLPQIGAALGRDHSTVSHGIRMMETALAMQSQYRQEAALWAKVREEMQV